MPRQHRQQKNHQAHVVITSEVSTTTVIYYSLCSIKCVAKIDVSRHILVSRYIHITDMFYGIKGVYPNM
jgi:hypothetical protein